MALSIFITHDIPLFPLRNKSVYYVVNMIKLKLIAKKSLLHTGYKETLPDMFIGNLFLQYIITGILDNILYVLTHYSTRWKQLIEMHNIEINLKITISHQIISLKQYVSKFTI